MFPNHDKVAPEKLKLAEEAAQVPTEDRADGGPGAGHALDEPHEAEVEEDVEEQVDAKPSSWMG